MEIVTPKNAALMGFIVFLSPFFLYNVSNYNSGLKKKKKKDTVGRLCLSQIDKCTYFSHIFTFTVCDIISRHVISCVRVGRRMLSATPRPRTGPSPTSG